VTDTYSIPEDFHEIQSTIRRLARERVAPRAGDIDRDAAYPHDLRQVFAEHDVLGLPFDEEHGGTGTGELMLNIAIEEIAKACASTALMLVIQGLGSLPIRLAGSEEMKARVLPRLATGEWTPAFALSEPDAGSDPAGMRTRAVRGTRSGKGGDEWVLHGTKNWITNAGIANVYVVFAVTDTEAKTSRAVTAFLVEAGQPGFSVGKLEHKLGIRGSPTAPLAFDGVRVPATNVIGAVGRGFPLAMATLDRSRLGVAAQALGIAQGAADYAAGYARERVQFGKPLNEIGAIQIKLADMETKCAAARELLYQACARADRGDPELGKFSAMAKLFCSDTAMEVTVEAVQVLGGYGYVNDYPVERMMRDAKITQIYEGTNEIQRVVIARTLK